MTHSHQKSGSKSPYRRRCRSIWIALCALTLTGSLETRGAANARAATVAGHISGTVRRADNSSPIANAKLQLESRCGYDCTVLLGTTTTNTIGFYEFYFQDNGSEFQVRAITEGYVSEVWGEATTGDYANIAPSAEHIDFRLVPTATITGVVKDQQGLPVADLLVRALRLRYFYSGSPILGTEAAQAKTDSAGRYRLREVAPGSYYVQTKQVLIAPLNEFAYTSDFYPREINYGSTLYPDTSALQHAVLIRATAGVELDGIDLHVRKVPTHSIFVTVDSDIASGKFQLGLGSENWPDEPGPALPDKQSGDENFTFKFSHVAPGHYLLVESNGTVSQGFNKLTINERDLNVTIKAKTSASIRGRIQLEDDSGEPPKMYDQIGLNPAVMTRIDVGKQIPVRSNGEFNILNVQPNTYFISFTQSFMSGPIKASQPLRAYLKSVSCNGNDYTFKPFTVTAGESIDDCIITARRDGGRVDGNVDIAGRGLRRWTIYFIPADLAMRRFRSLVQVSDTDGSFQESMIPPGEYLLYAVPLNKDGFSLDTPNFFEINADLATRITIAPNRTLQVTLKPIP